VKTYAFVLAWISEMRAKRAAFGIPRAAKTLLLLQNVLCALILHDGSASACCEALLYTHPKDQIFDLETA
jgi:hypothetical protein